MRFPYFSLVFVLSGAVILTVAGSASAQTTSPSLTIYSSFAGQYDTSMGWRTNYGNASVGNPMAEPTIAAGVSDGQTRLILGANNSLGQFYNALQGPDQYHNAQQDLASVFSGILPSGFVVTQPQVLRDQSPYQLPGQATQTLERYIVAARAGNSSGSRILISVTSSDLVGETGQCLYWFDANDSQSNDVFPDSPRMGKSGNAVLITANMYSTADSSFQYAKLWMIPKASLYNDPSQGGCPAFSAPASLVLNQPNSDGSLPFSVVPVKSDDSSPTAYMVNSLSNGGNTLTLWVLDTSDPTAINGVYGPVATNPYSNPPNAEQLGTSALITTWNTRLFTAVYQPGSGLWTVNTTSCTPPGDTNQRSCLQWYELDPSSFAVVQQGLVQAPGYHFYAPAIAANPFADAVLVFNGSAANQYAGIYAAGHYHTDPLNTVQNPIQIKSGEGCYVRSNGGNTVALRGEVTVDPIYSGLFWLHGAFAANDLIYGPDPTCQHNDWTTGVAAVDFQ